MFPFSETVYRDGQVTGSLESKKSWVATASTQTAYFLKLLIESFGRNRKGGAEFLCEQRDFIFLKHPAEFLHGSSCLGRLCGSQVSAGLQVGSKLSRAFAVFHRIERSAFGPDEQRLEVAWQMSQSLE